MMFAPSLTPLSLMAKGHHCHQVICPPPKKTASGGECPSVQTSAFFCLVLCKHLFAETSSLSTEQVPQLKLLQMPAKVLGSKKGFDQRCNLQYARAQESPKRSDLY